ncbi:MAG: HNH endonuclease [Chitinophagales bacterium]
MFRQHSAGYAFYQHWEGNTCETLYLHKLIAGHFIHKPDTNKRLFVHMKNGNKLDCRIKNLEWVTMGMLRRHMSPVKTKTGYRGVIKDKKYFRSVLNVNGQRINLGSFKTAEEAAEAYNKKSLELFGQTASLNKMSKSI